MNCSTVLNQNTWGVHFNFEEHFTLLLQQHLLPGLHLFSSEIGNAEALHLGKCVFRSKVASESGTSRPLNPEHVVHRIRCMLSTFCE